MKKIFGVLLSVLCICCAAIGLTGCKKNKHIHAFDKQVITDEYKATAATCTEKATYYYSCSCGEKGTETFTSGNALGHSFTNYLSDNNATCTEDGTKTAVCDRDGCNEKNTVTDVGSAKGHTYSKEWSQSETEHWHSATCGHNVEKDRAKHTFDENKKCTVCDYITVKPLGLELQSSVFDIDKSNKTGYLKVANTVTDYDFSDKFTVADGARFAVCTDKECNNKIASKKTDIVAGDNIFYILVTNGNDVASYTVTLRRRPIYTVSFNANGGAAVNSQSIEEDTIISEPVTTRAGYTFISWSYDFTQPIMEDTDITATWTANNDTPYKVEYYLENLEDNNYTLIETENLQGTTDTTVTAEIKTYDHFTFNEKKSISSRSVSGGGSLVLKVYYTRNTYTLSNADTSYGEITNATTRKYGNDKIDSVATEYLGCEFLGWYNGEELLSNEKEYTFTIENNVAAKFKIKDEMSNFNFNSSVGTCNITGLKDKTVSEIIIPDYVTSIGEYAFRGCSGLTSITIPDSVTYIGNYAFEDCSGLKYIYITDLTAWCNISGLNYLMSCNSIDKKLYLNNNLVTTLTIPDSVTTIGSGAFSGCSGLTSVTIPDSVTSIGEYAFGGCSGLTSVTIPDSMTSIGVEAFRGCDSLASITLPFIGANRTANSGYNHVFGYIFGYTITSSSSSVSGATYQYYYNRQYYHYYIPASLKTVILSDNMTSIGSGVFDNCSSLTSVTIGNSVTSIGSSAFSDCSGLTSVTIPNSVTSIGSSAFEDCIGLTSVTIGNSVTSIGYYAFRGCSGLESLVVTTGNKKYHSANNCIIETETKKLIVGCKTSIIPSDGSVTSIGNDAFRDCGSLTSVTIPDSVTSIGDRAFYSCSGLTSVTIPDSVTSIGDYAFRGCRGLTSVTIPDSVTSIGESAFYDCSGLTSVIWNAENCTSAGSSSYSIFRYCSKLTSVTIGANVKTIPNCAFRGCSGLTSVTIPDSVTSIGWGAFYGCSGLKNITYKGTVKEWKNISKGSNWNYAVPTDCVIHCTGGNIKISD